MTTSGFEDHTRPAPVAATPFGEFHGVHHVVSVPVGAGQVDQHALQPVSVFKGIRYASAGRFEPPVLVGATDEQRDALRYGPQCPQLAGSLEKLLGAGSLGTDEDCLFLNVFTPACDDRRRPVLVWIHGGAFVTGSGAMPWYHGASLAASGDVVVVTCNYRLGAFGFTGTQNLGILDQVAVLRWVSQAISGFGGDPSEVTIFGESAGGAAVVALMAVPEATSLFRRAWAMSPSLPQLRSPQRAEESAAQLMVAAGVDSEDQLRGLSMEELLAAQSQVLADPAGALTAFAPAPDGGLVPDSLLDEVATDSRPLVIGTTRDEMHLFTAFDPKLAELDDDGLRHAFARCFGHSADHAISLYRKFRPGDTNGQLVSALKTDETFRMPARDLADARSARHNPTWSYWFTHATSKFDGLLGSCHGLDIPYIFHNLTRPGVAMFCGDEEGLVAVADEFSGALLLFARTGEPGWNLYEPQRRLVREVGIDSATLADPEGELRELWSTR